MEKMDNRACADSLPARFRRSLSGVDRMPTAPQLETQEIGDVTVIRFRDSRITNPLEIEELGRQLYRVLELKNYSKLVIDFSPVEFLSSAMIGKLISLNRKAKVCKSALRFCNLRPEIREIFHFCNLERIFEIREDQAAAIASF
jgi:anti-sigma B factor antagonist